MRRLTIGGALTLFLFAASTALAGVPYPPSPVIADVSFDWSTHRRHALGSDNWQLTWADDDHQYGAWGDGGGFGGDNTIGRADLGFGRIEGNWDNYRGFNVWGGKDTENPAQFSGKSWGTICVGGVLYLWVVPDRPDPGGPRDHYRCIELARSTDHAAHWTKANWRWQREDNLIVPTFLVYEKDNAGARDDYVYAYFIRPQDTTVTQAQFGLSVHKPGALFLARVSKDKVFAGREAYEWFTGIHDGKPTWGPLAAKRPVFENPEGTGWCVSASYNPGLRRYLVATEHSVSGAGVMSLFDAPEPWGPWTTVKYWTASDRFGKSRPGSALDWADNVFFFSFAPKWFSPDGRSFTLVFTGGGNGKNNDSFNTVRGTFQLRQPSPVPAGRTSLPKGPMRIAPGKEWQPDAGILAGTAKVDVTPPLPAPYDLLQVATEIAHPLYARVVYLEDDNDRVVLVATDYEGILRSAHDMLRAAVAEATGVPDKCVILGANHSHNAPWINLDVEDLLAPHGLRQVDKKDFRETGAAELGGECVSLFFQGCAGNVVPPQGLLGGSKESVEKAGRLFADRALPILTSGMRRVDSGDFGFACRRVKLPLSPLREHGSMDFIRSMFAKPAVNALATHRTLTLPELEEEFRKALLLYQDCLRRPDDGGRYSYVLNLTAYGDRLTLARNLDRWSQCDLQALCVGPLCLVFLPGEPFIEIALAIRERSEAEFTFVSGYSDATPVYVPDETAFEEGGYGVGPWCYSTPETGKVLVREAVSLMKSLKPSEGHP